MAAPPAAPRSPKRFVRRHIFHATIGTEAKDAKRVLLTDEGTIVSEGDGEDNNPVHSYESLAPLRPRGAATFGKDERTDTLPPLCPNHAYAEPPSSMSGKGALLGTQARKALLDQTPVCPEAYYASPASTLSRIAATFGRSAAARDLATTRGVAPVHSYVAPTSTLRGRGAVPFGSTAPRSLLVCHSRTGLIAAAATARPLPRLKPLPKLTGSRAGSPTSILAHEG